MSEENVEITRRVYRELAEGKFPADLFDPGVVAQEPPEVPDAATYKGTEGVRALLGKLQESFKGMQFEPVDFSSSIDRVLVEVRWVGEGHESGVPSEMHLFHVWQFRHGRAVRIEAIIDRDKALEAAGLSE
jgi:ketosteroid isomerase-like protein